MESGNGWAEATVVGDTGAIDEHEIGTGEVTVGDDFIFEIPSRRRRGSADSGSDPGTDAGARAGAGAGTRRTRRRKASASRLDIDGLTALIYALHYGLFAERAPTMVLTADESRQLATGIANLQRHFPDLPISPWAIDAAFLLGTAGKIYIPRIMAMKFGSEETDGTQITEQ
jgi:hypothetical protein